MELASLDQIAELISTGLAKCHAMLDSGYSEEWALKQMQQYTKQLHVYLGQRVLQDMQEANESLRENAMFLNTVEAEMLSLAMLLDVTRAEEEYVQLQKLLRPRSFNKRTPSFRTSHC